MFKTFGSSKELELIDEKGDQVKCVLNGDIVLKELKDETGNQVEMKLV